MRFYFNSIFIIIILFINCGSDSSDNISSNNYKMPHSTDLFSFELSFGSELSNTKDDFLLEGGVDFLFAKNDGDILLFDEDRLKVYNKFGKGIKLIGRLGQGPGEFESGSKLFMGPKEYLMVASYNSYNLYSPDYTFIEKKRFHNNQIFLEYLNDKFPGYNISSVKKIIPLNKSEKVYQVTIKNETTKVVLTSLVYEDENAIYELIHFKRPGYLMGEKGTGVDTPLLGLLAWDLLPDRRIIYINTDDDKHSEQNGSYYAIHIISIDNYEETQIKRKFSPIEYSEKLKNSILEYRYPRDKNQNIKLLNEKLVKILSEKKYYPSIQNINIDGYYAFIFLKLSAEKIKNSERISYIVDVFDLKAGEFIKQVVFSNYFISIKNGYAYEDALDIEGFAEIRKYKLHSSLYGK